jgi:hypothetical protein
MTVAVLASTVRAENYCRFHLLQRRLNLFPILQAAPAKYRISKGLHLIHTRLNLFHKHKHSFTPKATSYPLHRLRLYLNQQEESQPH